MTNLNQLFESLIHSITRSPHEGTDILDKSLVNQKFDELLALGSREEIMCLLIEHKAIHLLYDKLSEQEKSQYSQDVVESLKADTRPCEIVLKTLQQLDSRALVEVASSNNKLIAMPALTEINEAAKLQEVVLGAKNPQVQKRAIEKIDSASILQELSAQPQITADGELQQLIEHQLFGLEQKLESRDKSEALASDLSEHIKEQIQRGLEVHTYLELLHSYNQIKNNLTHRSREAIKLQLKIAKDSLENSLAKETSIAAASDPVATSPVPTPLETHTPEPQSTPEEPPENPQAEQLPTTDSEHHTNLVQASQSATQTQEEEFSVPTIGYSKEVLDNVIQNLKNSLEQGHSKFRLQQESLSLHEVRNIVLVLQNIAISWEKIESVRQDIEKIDSQFLFKQQIKDLMQLEHRANEIINRKKRYVGSKLESILAQEFWLEDLQDKLGLILDNLNMRRKSLKDKIIKRIQEVEEQVGKESFAKTRRSIRRLIDRVPELLAEQREPIRQQLKNLESEVIRLQNLHHEIVKEKQQDVCEKMESLIEADIAEEQKDQQIKIYKRQWRELSVGLSHQPLWRRFQTAVQACNLKLAGFYETRKAKMQYSKEQKSKLVQHLHNHFEGLQASQEPPTTSLQEQLSQEKFQLIQKFKQLKKDNPQFHFFSKDVSELLNNIDALLEPYYQIQATKKKDIIKRTIASKNHSGIIPETLLQSLRNQFFELTGFAGAEDKALRQEFRELIAEQQKKTNQEKKQQFKSLKNEQKQEREIFDKLDKLAKKSQTPLMDEEKLMLEGVKKQLASAQLGKKQQFAADKKLQAIENALERKAHSTHIQMWQALYQAGKEYICLHLENEEHVESKSAELQQKLKNIHNPLAANMHQAISDRSWKQIAVENEEALRRKCIDLEIYLKIESPSEDADLRSKMKIQALLEKFLSSDEETPAQKTQKLRTRFSKFILSTHAGDAKTQSLAQRYIDTIVAYTHSHLG